MEIDDTLFIIPARGGSRALPRKNILPLAGKPMICYSIESASKITKNQNICLSTDDQEIIEVAEQWGLKVPFVRPAELATDTSGSREVILHALDYYENHLSRSYSKVCLLQPTSPLRTYKHIIDAFKLWNDELDMVVSVKESKANPYFNLFEEDNSGYLKKSKDNMFTRRQDVPAVWEYNGAIYIIKVDSIRLTNFSGFNKVRKFVMSIDSSVDIDTELDYKLAELLMQRNQ